MPTPKIAIIFQIFAKNCMKMKEFGPPGRGAHSWHPPLDLPMVTAVQGGNPKCTIPNFGSLEMSNFAIYVMYFVVTGFFEDPKFGTLHLGLLPCIAVTD